MKNTIGNTIINGWKSTSITHDEYVRLAEKLTADGLDGKSIALKKYVPLEKYINVAYYKYKDLCYYLNIQPLPKGKWLRSNTY